MRCTKRRGSGNMAVATTKTKVHHMVRNRRVWTADIIALHVISIFVLSVFALLCVIPFYLILVASFTPEDSLIRNGYPLIPVAFDFQSYALCIKNPVDILLAYATTIGVTLIGTTCAVFLATMTGYVLSRKDFPWRQRLSFFSSLRRCLTED